MHGLRTHDYLVVGAGFAGSILAERLASQRSRTVLLIDRRDHIAGNAFDYLDEHGVLCHRYGPHIFHTNSKKVWDYLGQFTAWRPYEHRVLAEVDGKRVPVPFNLTSLHMLFPKAEADRLEEILLKAYGEGTKVPILRMRQSEVREVRDLAEWIYTKIFLGYTLKQWDLRPEDLDPSVTARVPVMVGHDDRYFQDKYQAMPAEGYTAMFRRMLERPGVTVRLGLDFAQLKEDEIPERVIYTGPIDEFLGFRFGHLPYRSLRFRAVFHQGGLFQETGQINYPNSHAFTRTTEFRYLTGQICSGTTIAEEYPQPHIPGENEPYYPMPVPGAHDLYERYEKAAREEYPNVIFLGRLADYVYYNMDQVVARALAVFDGMS